ncbi:MAG: RDD family protein, partial [Gammaproteobacteria bacterium]|nr:RDD family protein [Gammaproteobacteria bacterium]
MSSTDSRAGRVRRLCAFTVDFVITAAVAFVAMWPLGTFENEQAYEPSQLVIRIVLLIAGSYLLVNGWLLHRRGQTVGKRLLRIRMLSNADGRP